MAVAVYFYVTPTYNNLILKIFKFDDSTRDLIIELKPYLLYAIAGVSAIILARMIAGSISQVVTYLGTDESPVSSEALQKIEELGRLQSRLSRDVERIKIKSGTTSTEIVTQYLSGIDTQARQAIKEKLESIRPEEIISSVGQTFEIKLRDESRKSATADLIYEHFARLLQEIGALSRRANVNLVLGMFISLAGMLLLGVFVFELSASTTHREIGELILIQSSKLGLVMLIEVFAYFFLRLYRYSLFEIKYFQNEITTGEFRIIALLTALRLKNETTIPKVLESFSKYDRNSVLRRGETTQEILRDELSAKNERSALVSLDKMVERLRTIPKGP